MTTTTPTGTPTERPPRARQLLVLGLLVLAAAILLGWVPLSPATFAVALLLVAMALMV